MSVFIPQEEDRMRPLPVVLLILFTLAVIAAGIWWPWAILTRERPGAGEAVEPDGPPRRGAPPQEEIGGIRQTLIEEKAMEEELRVRPRRAEAVGDRLESWGWVDRERGVIHIPVERAMELWLEKRATAGSGSGPNAGSAPAAEPEVGTPPSGEEGPP